MRLNEKENAHLNRQLAASGLKRQVYVRKLIMGHEIRSRPPAEWPALVRQVSAIGNNINQMARVANIERSVSEDTMREVMRLLAAVWEKVKSI